MSQQGAFIPHVRGERPLRCATWRGLLFGARVGMISWCLLAVVGVIVYVGVTVFVWYQWGKIPEYPDGWLAWLRALGSFFGSLALTTAHGAITGAVIMLAAAILRRRHSSETPKQ